MLSHFYHFEYFILIATLLGCSLVCIGFWMAPEGWRKTSKGRKTTIVLGGLISLGSFTFTVMDMSHVSEEDLEAWISEYDPFFKPEDEQPDYFSPYWKYEDFGRAVSVHRRGGGTAPIDAALKGVQGAGELKIRSWAEGPLAPIGLLSPSTEELPSVLEGLREQNRGRIKRYGTNGVPLGGWLQEVRAAILLLVQTDLLSEEDETLFLELLVANLHYEAKGEAPDKWRENYTGEFENLGIGNIRICVESLIALDASEALQEVEDLVLSAIQGVYRKHDASFDLTPPASEPGSNLMASIETADDALFLMEHYGVPGFLDLPGFHKYLDGERTGHSPHSPPEYLAAALMFRLEQLHPEL